MKTPTLILLTGMLSFAGATWAAALLPTGESVVAGSASVSRSGADMTVTTGSNRTIINWNGFGVGGGGTVQFVQPSASSAVLNRVVGGDVSQIHGAITSNGQFFLLNPNGIIVSSSGSIQASGIFLSTAAIADADFLAGTLRFEAPPAGTAIEVAGTLTATNLIDIRASSFDGTGGTITAPTVNLDGSAGAAGGGGAIGGGGGIAIGGGGITTGGDLITGGDITIGAGGIVGPGSFVGGTISLGVGGNLNLQPETRKLLQRTAGTISLRGTSALVSSAPSAPPVTTATSLPIRSATPAIRVNAGPLADGAVTVRVSLVDVAPITLR